MADIHFEIFDNADFGNKNLRFSEAPAKEQRDFLKQNGYGFTTRYGGVWYPRTQEAKDRNADFVKEFAEKFYPENRKSSQPNQIEQLAEQALENNPPEVNSPDNDRIAYLENLIAELKEERKRDQEKISRLEAALESQDEENSAELEMQMEQAELDDEAEWEKENTLTDEEEKAYIEKQSEIKIPAETIEITSEMLDSLHEAAEKESRAYEPLAEKKILHDAEKSADDDLTVSPQELAVAKSVLPTIQYVSTLKFAQGEEREFFVHKIKEIAAAVENAPKINETDGLEEHRIVLRYFHPSGTQSFVTEIGNDGDAFGFQCLNDDWENAEWGYLNIDELKNIRGMEVDFHVPAGMTVEKFIQKEKPEQYSAEDITTNASKETGITWNDILQAAEGSHWNDEANAVYNNARKQLAEYAKNLGVDIENTESPEEAAGIFASTHEEISFSKDGNLVIDETLKPVYFNDLSDVQKEEVINGYRSADDQKMLETWQKELDNSSEADKDIASNPPSDEWIASYLSETKVDFNTGYWQDIFKNLEKEESHGKTISELSADEASRLSEEKYGFYFEYSDDENVADIYSVKDGDFVGSYGAGGFGYADDLSGNDPATRIPEENFREVLELAEIFYHKKAAEYENLIETENGQMMNPDEAHEWNEEQKMQYSQEDDEREAETANRDFETTKRLDEIISEIKKSDFTLESKYENEKHTVILTNNDGEVIFSAKENDNIVIPVEHTIAAWANDEASEKAKNLADEFFNLVCDDGIRGGDYVNAVFKKYTAENYYQLNDSFAVEIVPAESPLSSGKMSDDWTIRFYDIKNSEKFGEKGQFITSYYASSMLEHRKGTGLSLQGDVPAWTVDAEAMDYVHDITFMWVDRHSSVQQKEDAEVSQEEIEQEKAFVQKKIQLLKDELNNPENAGDEQQDFDVRKNIENLESLTDEDIKNQILWKKENQKKNDETRSRVVELMMEEKQRKETPQEGELLSYNEKNPTYSVANKETKRETSIQPRGRLDENVRKLGGLANLSEANGIIEKIKSSGFDILSTESRIIIFDKDKYYDFNSHSDSGYFNYETKKFEFDLDKRNLNEWDFRDYVKGGLKITKRMKDFAKIEKQNISKELAATNFVLEKLKTAGIEVITDKEEFDRILQREEFLQKMSKGQSPKYLNSADLKMLKGWGYKTTEDLTQIQTAMLLSEIRLNGKKTGVKKAVEILGREKFLGGISRSAFHSASAKETGGNYVEFDSSALFSDRSEDLEKLRAAEKESKEHISVLSEIAGKEIYFQFNEEDTKSFIEKVDKWQKDNTNPHKLLVVGKIPPVMKVLGIADKPIEVEQATLDKMVRDNPLYPNDRQGHELSIDDIYAIPGQLADPVMVFKSRTRDDSYVFFTERKDSENRSILIPLAVNKRMGRIVINEITSMYGRNNEIDFVESNLAEDNLIYLDKARSLEWIDNRLEKEKSSNGERYTKLQLLGQRFTDIETYSLNILTKERLVNFISAGQSQSLQKMSVSDGETYGFAYNGKIYLNPDVMNSNAAVHEYTHLWDSYTQRTNPKLWQKGKDIFKDTVFWEEVKNDPGYSDIADDDDLVLSEIHARICGGLAQKVLEHIAETDGEITKDRAVDWNAETAAYILDLYKKMQLENEFVQNMDASEFRKEIVEFLSMPMKDLMAGKNISVLLSDMKNAKEKNKRESKSAGKDFKITKRLDKIISEIKKSDFTLESRYENEKHSVILANENGKVIFRAKENDNTEIPVDYTAEEFADYEAYEIAKSLSDEFFNLVCENEIYSSDYVNTIFKREFAVHENGEEVGETEINTSYIAENYYPVSVNVAIEFVPAIKPLSSNKIGDDWLVKFYDTRATEKFGEKGQFISSYYASMMLEHTKGTNLSLQENVPALTVGFETMNYVHDLTFGWLDRHTSIKQKIDKKFSSKSYVENTSSAGVTHFWDAYTRNANSKLWKKGKELFKSTHYWNEVKNSFKDSDIDDNDDLVLSEIHARICGGTAQRVLGHIERIDGVFIKTRAIKWNHEIWAYTANEINLQNGRKSINSNKTVAKSEIKKIREQCREILKKSDSEITEDDKKILAQYEGGGGLDEEERTNSEVLNAFYTPDNLIEKVWSLVDAYAPDAKSVLEPSAGVGKFANNRPNNKFTMHELDETSARINKILHPEAEVIQGAFQKQFLDDGERFLKIGYEQPKHDVVIGNPPYGKYNDKYKGLGEGREFDRYEEYFIARGLDALKDEKSVLAFVVPSGFLSTADDRQKKIIASKGEILDAYRLPEGTFSTTEVGTDILIMRKNGSLDDRKNISSEFLSDGEWFKNHPEKILGEIKTRTNRFGKEEEYVAVHERLSVQDELNKIDSFVDEIKKTNQTEKLKDPLPEYSLDEDKAEVISSPEIFTDEFGENISKFKKSLNNYFEKGIRPKNDRFVIGKTPLVLQKIGSDVTEVTVPVSVIKKAVKTHGLSQDEIFSSLAKMYNPVIVFDSDKNATENKVESKLILTDVFKDENPVALAVNTNSTVDINNRGLTVEVQDIRSIHDRNVVAKNGTDLIQKWAYDGLCRYVNDKKITDWSTVARVQFPIELLQSDNLNILTSTALVNSVFSEQMVSPLKENEKTEPENQNSSLKVTKEKWNISKSKGEVMTAEEFSHLYGRDFDEREFPIWKATDWQGNIDLSKLSGDDIQYLSESGKYVEKNIGEWTHKELFASGDIYEKIQEQRELYVKSDRNQIFADNIKLLESAMKSPLEMEKIHFGVKTSLAESFKIEHIDAEGNKVNLNLQESFILWAQNAKLSDQKWRGDIDFATANISREELGEELSFYDIVNYIDGKPVKAEAVRGWRTYDMSEEEKAAEKAERRKEADLKRQARSDTANRLFDRYLHEGLSESDKKRLSAEYNRRFNSYVAPDYSKLPLFVDGMSAYKGDSKFKLYDQQIKGISFLCNKGNGILAYDVGVGKTAAGIVATVNQIQTGRSSRPLIVVPNSVYPKWYTDIRQLFPNMKLNNLYNFNCDFVSKYQDKKNPHRLNIPENSISLCTYEALRNITFNDKSCENDLYEDFASLLSADMDGSARENAESSDKIKGIIGSASHVKDADYFFYEDCGFDNLTVDEVHNFKNLWVVPRPKKKGESNEYAGIPSGKPSARALKMYGMTQLTQRHNDDRNVFMLTATPFTNSPTEVYSMLSYVGRERLKQAGITSLRAFFDEFAQTKQELGVTSTGNIDTKQVMKSWKELPALQNILTEFIDKVDGEEAGIIRPNKFTHVKPLDMSDLQKEMREIDEERMADVKKGNSAAVIVAMNNMRLSCVAPALANPAMYPGIELPPLSKLVETSPKLKFVCDAIIDMYKGNPEKGQFMYVPLGKESHGIIKDYLVAHGIPKEAVEIINGEVNNTPEKKEKITSCFNDEKNPCKIIIGGKNTSEGIDLNGNSFVMYNCSLGWNPSETIQAEGRIWRQGNLQGNVHIVYPVMNDSIDSVLYQKHDEKRSRINELWNYKGDSLNVEDINPEDLKLDLIKDPNKKAKLILQEETKEARAELSRLNLKIKSFDEIIEKRKQLELDFSDAKETVDYQKKQIESYKESGLEVPEWMKSELKDCNKKFAKAETGLEKVREKLSSLKITDSEKETEYIHNLNKQKHDCEAKICNIEKTLPQILKKLEIERMEQKLIEYPVEKQREILEADILNNLRPMKEVEYEIKTMRHEAMLSEKLKAGEITEKEFTLYKNAGYEKYEKWLNGEIESLEESSVKNESANEISSIENENENDIEKIIVYYDGHWADERGEKGKGWKYQEKSFDNPKDALDFYKTAKIPKEVGAENASGFRFNFMNPEEKLLKMISEQDKNISVQNENLLEKTAVKESEQKDLKKAAEKTEPAKQPEQDMDSLYSDSGSLFFGLGGSDILSVHSPENEYRKSVPYDDFSITERQLTESELKRDEIIFPVLNGKESGMYKAFKDFAEHGVFDVQGKKVELDGSGRISGTGWNQLQAAMEIYRNKQFETFRYVLIGREDGEIKDQLAVKSYSPNRCAVSTPDLQTIKQVITRAEELDCMVAAVHNHPSGNTVESSFDAELTESLKRNLTNGNGFCRFAGHIILDHDTFNLYTPENGWKMKLNSNAYGNLEDELLNKNFAFLEDSVDYTWQLENVAKKINDRNNWNDNFIPVVFADSLNHVSGIKLYDKSFFDNEPQKIRNELQFSGLEANSVKAFPVITKNFAETMSAVDELLFEDKLKNLVEHSAFIDAALPESTVTEKFNILPGRQYFDVHGAKMKNPDIEATWQTRINPALFSEPEQKVMRKKEVAFER